MLPRGMLRLICAWFPQWILHLVPAGHAHPSTSEFMNFRFGEFLISDLYYILLIYIYIYVYSHTKRIFEGFLPRVEGIAVDTSTVGSPTAYSPRGMLRLAPPVDPPAGSLGACLAWYPRFFQFSIWGFLISLSLSVYISHIHIYMYIYIYICIYIHIYIISFCLPATQPY